MSYTKYRGHKHHGRGHRKNKSGSRGGTGRAGCHKHKLTHIKPAYKKRQKYISANLIVTNTSKYIAQKKIVVQNQKYLVLASMFPKILNKKALPNGYELHFTAAS